MTVNETRGIEHGYALFDGKAATRLNEAGVSFRNGNGDSGRNQGSFERLNLEALDRAKIHAGIAGVRVRRNFNPVNKGGQRYGQGIGHGSTPSLCDKRMRVRLENHACDVEAI